MATNDRPTTPCRRERTRPTPGPAEHIARVDTELDRDPAAPPDDGSPAQRPDRYRRLRTFEALIESYLQL